MYIDSYSMSFSKSLVAASSKPLILGILRSGKSYGYEIIQKVKEISGGQLQWSDGMLYPVLHRLEKEELIKSEWIMSGGSRPRKYYSITELGKQSLRTEQSNWSTMNEVLVKLFTQTEIK